MIFCFWALIWGRNINFVSIFCEWYNKTFETTCRLPGMCRKGITKLSTVLTALSSVLYEIMICNCVEIHLQITFQTKKRLKTEKNGQITVPENVLFPGLRQELPRVSKIVMTTFSKFQTFFKVFASGFFCLRFFWSVCGTQIFVSVSEFWGYPPVPIRPLMW